MLTIVMLLMAIISFVIFKLIQRRKIISDFRDQLKFFNDCADSYSDEVRRLESIGDMHGAAIAAWAEHKWRSRAYDVYFELKRMSGLPFVGTAFRNKDYSYE